MRYLARRIRTGQWLHRDLPLGGVQRSRVLSGPSTLAGTIEPELFRTFADDGLRILDPYFSTWLYCENDAGDLVSHGIIQPPHSWAAAATQVTAAGVSSFAQGYIYNGIRNYGPDTADDEDRPDTIDLFRQLWDHINTQPMSNVGVNVTGPLRSGVPIGTLADPYTLAVWRGDDVGKKQDDLAKMTPFDYIERQKWANLDKTEVALQVEVGYPRLGYPRTDLRFVEGENIVEAVELAAPEGYANDVIGWGNGTGSTLILERATVDDGRLKRSRLITDKTVRTREEMQALVTRQRDKYVNVLNEPDIASIHINSHPNAQVGAINPGDDILVQAFIPAYGPVRTWYRVLSITQTEDDYDAVLNLQRSATFIYNTTTQEDTADPGDAQ